MRELFIKRTGLIFVLTGSLKETGILIQKSNGATRVCLLCTGVPPVVCIYRQGVVSWIRKARRLIAFKVLSLRLDSSSITGRVAGGLWWAVLDLNQ